MTLTRVVRAPGVGVTTRRWSGLRLSLGRARMLIFLIALTVCLGAPVLVWPQYAPLMLLAVPMAVSSLVLGPRELPWFVVFVMLVLAGLVAAHDPITVGVVVSVAAMFLLGLYILLMSFRRSRLGVGGLQGEEMLVDLRDRIQRQGGIPPLPPQWYAASELRSAGGTKFAGDFVVAARDGSHLNVAVVDVSGKGEGAGTRALLLSGALGGLLGALPSDEFLPAANDFLLRQDWEEGFASAVHLSLDLETGAFALRSAGHPPAVLREAGSGRWKVLEAEGPVLGLIEGAEFSTVHGNMRHGDALLLYTDGLVEAPHRDIMLGLDRMLGQAERLLRGQFEGGAARLVEALGSRNDDRALLLVHRR